MTSDYGEFCREQRRQRQRLRMHWHECPTCALNYGTGTKVAPGKKCRNCGWSAPGNFGDDRRAADELDRKLKRHAKPRKRGVWECPYCDMSFATKSARGNHVNKVHQDQHLAERRSLKQPKAQIGELEKTNRRQFRDFAAHCKGQTDEGL